MKNLLLLAVSMFLLSGCGIGGFSLTNDMSNVNQMIADSNDNRFKAFAEGMSKCNDNAACQVGLSMAFAGGLGKQEFYKPETTADLLRAFVPYASLLTDIYKLTHMDGGSTGGEASPYIKGDGNTIFLMNKNHLTESTVNSWMYPQSYKNEQFNVEGDNHGTQPAADPVIVQPSYPPAATVPTEAAEVK